MATKKKASAITTIKYELSDELAAIVGKSVATRADVTKKVWEYIKKHGLNNGRKITPDADLAVVTGKASFDMMKLAGKLSPHFIDRV